MEVETVEYSRVRYRRVIGPAGKFGVVVNLSLPNLTHPTRNHQSLQPQWEDNRWIRLCPHQARVVWASRIWEDSSWRSRRPFEKIRLRKNRKYTPTFPTQNTQHHIHLRCWWFWHILHWQERCPLPHQCHQRTLPRQSENGSWSVHQHHLKMGLSKTRTPMQHGRLRRKCTEGIRTLHLFGQTEVKAMEVWS